MVDRYAIVDATTHMVVNVALWDGLARWSPPEGTFLARDASDTAEPGALWVDGTFLRRPREDSPLAARAAFSALRAELADYAAAGLLVPADLQARYDDARAAFVAACRQPVVE